MDAGSALERSPYLVLGRLVLMPDRGPGKNEAAQAFAAMAGEDVRAVDDAHIVRIAR